MIDFIDLNAGIQEFIKYSKPLMLNFYSKDQLILKLICKKNEIIRGYQLCEFNKKGEIKWLIQIMLY